MPQVINGYTRQQNVAGGATCSGRLHPRFRAKTSQLKDNPPVTWPPEDQVPGLPLRRVNQLHSLTHSTAQLEDTMEPIFSMRSQSRTLQVDADIHSLNS